MSASPEGLHLGWGRRLPMALQTEAAECGLACLAMVAGFFGRDVDTADLRRRFGLSLKLGRDFELIEECAGVPQRWVLPRGTTT